MAPVGFLETEVIYCDDNVGRLSQFPAESVDLIYLDPPFFSNKRYEVVWGDEAEVRSFEDRFAGGIYHYIDWMRERAIEIVRVLKPTGSMYLHCDWHASHYLKVMLDEVFGGADHFRNDIAWCYRGGGVSKRWWARKHDSLLFYTKGKTWTFNAQYTPYSESTVAVTGRTGRRVNKTEIDLERGGHMPDWWTDINSLQTWSPERIGYPTQKPPALLTRIIEASSNPGDIVLDPFCGCGTTLEAAHQLDRRWIGIDISPTACNVMRRQLSRSAVDAKIIGLPVTLDDLKALQPFEFQNWVIDRINGSHSPRKVHDMGIDGYTFFTHDPVQVKQSEQIGRNVLDNFETAMRRVGRTKGYVVAFSFGGGAVAEVSRARQKDGLDIELVTVEELRTGAHVLAQGETTLFGARAPEVEPRAVDTLPSVEELVSGAEDVPLARAAEEPEDYGSN